MRLSLTAAVLACISATSAFAQDALTTQEARDEVEQVYSTLVERHPDLFWYTPESVWQARYDALLEREGPISVVQQYFDLSELLALAMDTHVQIYPEDHSTGFETTYPIRFRLYEGEIYVTAADTPYRDWVGQRVVSIAGQSAREIVDRIEHYAFSDNPARRQSWAVEHLLIQPAAYSYFNWMNAQDGVDLVLEDRSGRQHRQEMRDVIEMSLDATLRSGKSEAYFWPEGWRTLDDLSPASVPLHRARIDENFWHTYLDEGRVLYLQFNSSSDRADGTTFVQYTMALFQEIAALESPPERLVIDLRHNLGGWIARSLPLAYLAQASDLCCQRGSVVLLVGRETISAGAVFAGVAEIATRPVVIGEPSGGRPNIFLGHDGYTLPHSGLWPEASSEIYIGTDTSDVRMFIAPDIHVPERIEDIIAGRDAALEAALRLETEAASSFYPGLSPNMPWTRPSQVAADHDSD